MQTKCKHYQLQQTQDAYYNSGTENEKKNRTRVFIWGGRFYYFERAARIYITALQTGKELIFSSDEVAEKTAQQSENYSSDCHFNAVLDVLNEEEPEYLN